MAAGTGTQENPYVVTNVAEFREACTQLNAYVKLANDIDCDEYPEWNTLTCTCAEVDFNGKSLKKMYIQQSQIGLVSGYAGYISTATLFKNGRITDMYENNAKYFLDGGRFENMVISIYETTAQNIWRGIDIESCNVTVSAKRLANPKAPWFVQYWNADFLKDSCFFLDGVLNAGTIAQTYGGEKRSEYIKGCLFEGRINASAATGNIILLDGTINDTIWAVDTSTAPSSIAVSLADASDISNLYQNDNCAPNFSAGAAQQGNYNEIRDPDYNNRIGFTVVVK